MSSLQQWVWSDLLSSDRPPGCLVVMEDIDVGLSNGLATINREEAPTSYPMASAPPRITLSGLLNAIVSRLKIRGSPSAIQALWHMQDGVAGSEGRIRKRKLCCKHSRRSLTHLS